MFNRVADFHTAFGHPVGIIPLLPVQRVRDLRINLIDEELEEFCHAYAKNDRVEMADALADLLYVLAGTSVAYGIAPTGAFVSPYDNGPPYEAMLRYDDPLPTEWLKSKFDGLFCAERNGELFDIKTAIEDMMLHVFIIAQQLRIPINAVFAEVHRSNMSKLDENGNAILRDDGKVLKSHLYSPPNIAGVLEANDVR